MRRAHTLVLHPRTKTPARAPTLSITLCLVIMLVVVVVFLFALYERAVTVKLATSFLPLSLAIPIWRQAIPLESKYQRKYISISSVYICLR